jgi:hypothetical protein
MPSRSGSNNVRFIAVNPQNSSDRKVRDEPMAWIGLFQGVGVFKM